ncbi:MFS transporter [Balneolales bacterium ANBcel1]|nr:MFS transporter [Balneolales bacterium ANBcel1]
MEFSAKSRLSFWEKAGYALGDGAANIAWRGVTTFLFVFYTDVYGLNPASVGLLMLIARSSDGFSDVAMGIIGDRTHSRFGKFRPWILWTAVPLAVMLSMLFFVPDLSYTGKLIYAYSTYILFTLIYTANNVPYGALMAVMTGDNKERASIGSFRMVGAFAGGMLVQGSLLLLVSLFGNVGPEIHVTKMDTEEFRVTVSSSRNVENANISTDAGLALFVWADPDELNPAHEPAPGMSFTMEANEPYTFIISGEEDLQAADIVIIDQERGYSYSMFLMSVFLALFLIVTFFSTKERVTPPVSQQTNLKNDLKDLIKNRPWLVLLVIGLLFSVYNSIKQGIIVIYFSHYLNEPLMAGTFMVGLMLASIGGAMITAPLSRIFGKKSLFIYALIFSGGINALFFFCGPDDIIPIFMIGIVSEVGAAIFPTLFFAMLGDAADYSEYQNKRRATGLVYSAGSFATKFGGGVAGAIIGLVLAAFHYDGQDAVAIQGAIPGIIMLMSWIPAVIAMLAAVLMTFYPLNQEKMDRITLELSNRRAEENSGRG